MFGHLATEEQTTIVTVTDMPPVCGLFPLTPPPMTDRRQDMTSPALPLWLLHSVTAKVHLEMQAWYVIRDLF